MPNKLTPIIGMEIHVELNTNSKMFCGCPAHHFAVAPNTHTCPVCLGLPGALPVPNKQAVDWTIMLGLAINCDIAKNSKFDRKHYFYPDLPKGYQISQYDEPLCVKGVVKTSYGDIGITRVHLEEDTAKLQHTFLGGKKVSLVDFNHSSVPLMEIVTEPDITSAAQAKEYAQKIRQIVRYLGISDADMEKGSMRVEANISWGLDLGYKVEVKNINSFKFLEKAIEFELARQKQLLDEGKTPDQETRGWSEAKSATYSQRSKEDAQDYRYFPEPDIPPMIFTDEAIAAIKKSLPPLPDAMKQLFMDEYGIREDYANILVTDRKKANYVQNSFDEARKSNLEPMVVAKFIVNSNNGLPDEPKDLVKLVTTSQASPQASSEEIQAWVDEAIAANPDLVAKFKAGKVAVIGALVGDVMRRSKGQASAAVVNQLLVEKLK